MAARTEDLRREIEQARSGVGEALEAIGDRVAPKKVADRAKENVAEKVEEVKDKVSPGRIVRRRTMTMRSALARAVGRDDSEMETENVSEIGVQTRNGRSGSRSSELLGSTRSQAGGLTGRAGSAAESARSAPQAVRDRAEGNPVAAGLFVLAAGFFVGSMLPASDRERELTRRAQAEMEPLKEKLTETGKSIAGDLQQSAQQGLEQVKETATQAAQRVKQDAGARAESVKAQAQDATTEVKQESASSSERVKSGAKRSTAAVKDQAKQAKSETKAATKSTTKKAPAKRAPAKRTTAAPRL